MDKCVAVRKKEDWGGSVEKVEGRDCGGRRTYVAVGEKEALPRKRILYHRHVAFSRTDRGISAVIPFARSSSVYRPSGLLRQFKRLDLGTVGKTTYLRTHISHLGHRSAPVCSCGTVAHQKLSGRATSRPHVGARTFRGESGLTL